MSVTFVWLEREDLSRRANGQCGIERHDPDIRADIDEDIAGMKLRRITETICGSHVALGDMSSELWLLSIDDQIAPPRSTLYSCFDVYSAESKNIDRNCAVVILPLERSDW